MAVHIDEARGQHFSGQVDDPFSGLRGKAGTDFRDGIAGDTNVRAPRRTAGSVDELGVLEQQPVRLAGNSVSENSDDRSGYDANSHGERIVGQIVERSEAV